MIMKTLCRFYLFMKCTGYKQMSLQADTKGLRMSLEIETHGTKNAEIAIVGLFWQ
jgi:hypothetical protein